MLIYGRHRHRAGRAALGWAAEPALRNRSAYLPAVLPCTSIKTPDMLQNCRGNRLRNYRGLFLKSSRKKRTIFPRRYRNISSSYAKKGIVLEKAACFSETISIMFTYQPFPSTIHLRPALRTRNNSSWNRLLKFLFCQLISGQGPGPCCEGPSPHYATHWFITNYTNVVHGKEGRTLA